MKIKIISLTHGTKYIKIDEEDFEIIKNLKVYIIKIGNYFYARKQPDKQGLHRFIVGEIPKGMVVDHINGDTLDNRKSNLEIVSIKENVRRRHKHSSKSGHIGIELGYRGKFYAHIKVDYKKIHLGTFLTLQEAINARHNAEKKYFLFHQ